jgi:hypothetical protein
MPGATAVAVSKLTLPLYFTFIQKLINGAGNIDHLTDLLATTALYWLFKVYPQLNAFIVLNWKPGHD